MSTLKVKWYVDDGYISKDRPQYVEIYKDELEGLTVEKKVQYVHDRLTEEFENVISWYVDSSFKKEL